MGDDVISATSIEVPELVVETPPPVRPDDGAPRVCQLAWGYLTPGVFGQTITTPEACEAPAVCQIVATCPSGHDVTRGVCQEHREDIEAQGMTCTVESDDIGGVCARPCTVVIGEML